MPKQKLPIYLSDWKFKDKKGVTYTVENVIVKGENMHQILSQPRYIKRATKRLSGATLRKKLEPVNIILKSQHGYGPHYDDEKLFQ